VFHISSIIYDEKSSTYVTLIVTKVEQYLNISIQIRSMFIFRSSIGTPVEINYRKMNHYKSKLI
jgi:hypothetical protein